MILLLAVFAGLLAGWTRARLRGHRLATPGLRTLWLVPIAYLPQLIAFELPATRARYPDQWVPIVLIGSQVLLFVFLAYNIRQPGFLLLTIGLLLNLTVITLNGGWMPISPETVVHIAPNAPPGIWESGKRLGYTKDQVIDRVDTRLGLLSDRLTFPSPALIPVAFSIGDVLIACGAFWFLWSLGGKDQVK